MGFITGVQAVEKINNKIDKANFMVETDWQQTKCAKIRRNDTHICIKIGILNGSEELPEFVFLTVHSL